jgi:hypothetical protein
MNISSATAIDHLRRAVAEYEAHERIFSDRPRLPLSYEKMTDGQALRADVARDVCRFLGIGDHPMQSNLVKINPERLQDVVANYDQFANAIRKTEFAEMLD